MRRFGGGFQEVKAGVRVGDGVTRELRGRGDGGRVGGRVRIETQRPTVIMCKRGGKWGGKKKQTKRTEKRDGSVSSFKKFTVDNTRPVCSETHRS